MRCAVDHGTNRWRRRQKHDPGKPFDGEMSGWVRAAIDRFQAVLKQRGLKPMPTKKYKYYSQRP